MKGSGSWSIDALCGGPVLGARGKGFVVFWDWEAGEVVRRIDVEGKKRAYFPPFQCQCCS